jgi:hypothetical protein
MLEMSSLTSQRHGIYEILKVGTIVSASQHHNVRMGYTSEIYSTGPKKSIKQTAYLHKFQL